VTDLLMSDEVETSPPPSPRTSALLAVCALCGGAGASTLAYLTGAWVASGTADPVLVCDAGEPTAGLSAYAHTESLRSFGDLASGGPVTDGIFAEARPGLRLIATAPRMHEDVEDDAIVRLLRDARAEHPLTVVDCGRLASTVGRLAQRQASHVAWVLPATVSGVLRARRVLAVQEPGSDQREIVVARFAPGGRQPPISDLTDLAEIRRAPLVLMPDVPDLGERTCEEGLAAAQVTLEAIASLVRR
jgi:hypothetical protein